MASLYRKKNMDGKVVPSWYCTFRIPGPDGTPKQVHRSTGKTTKKEAEAAARLLEDAALAEAGAGDDKSKAIMQKVTEAGEMAMRGRLNPARAIRLIQEIRKLIIYLQKPYDYSMKSASKKYWAFPTERMWRSGLSVPMRVMSFSEEVARCWLSAREIRTSAEKLFLTYLPEYQTYLRQRILLRLGLISIPQSIKQDSLYRKSS